MSSRRQEILRDLENNLYAYTTDVLKQICEKYQIPAPRSSSRMDLVADMVRTLEEVVKKKHKPKNDEEFKTGMKAFIDHIHSQFPPPAESSNPPASVVQSGVTINQAHTPINTVVGGGSASNEESDAAVQKSKLKNMKDRCFCGQKGTKKDIGLWITCHNMDCGAKFHHECLPWRLGDIDNFECPSCIILNNDPLNDVIQILFDPSILISEMEYLFKLTSEHFSKITEDVNIGIELRSIKMDGEHFFEQTWPDKCSIKINSKLIKEVKPLHQNSSLKKRRDEKLFNRQNVKLGPNNISMSYQNVQDGKNTKLKQDPKYIFTIVLVRKISVEELSQRIRNINRLTVEESKEFIKEKFLANKDLEINEIKVNLIDNISFTHIKHPARGLYCDHVPCFSLDFFLQSMENNYTRKWACPICKKRCNKMIVDSYLETIIEQAKKKNPDLENVFFLKNGDVVFKSDIIEEEHLDFPAEKKKETKPQEQAESKKPPQKEKVSDKPVDKPLDKNPNPDVELEILSITSEGDKKVSIKHSSRKKYGGHDQFSTPKRHGGGEPRKDLHGQSLEQAFQDVRLDEYSPRTIDDNSKHEKDLMSPRLDDEDFESKSISAALPILRADGKAQPREDSQGEIRQSASPGSNISEILQLQTSQLVFMPEDFNNDEEFDDIPKHIDPPQLTTKQQEELYKANQQLVAKSYDLLERTEKRDESVIDRMINNKLAKDTDLRDDRIYLTNLYENIEKTLDEVHQYEYSNYTNYFENSNKKIVKEKQVSKMIGLLYEFFINRKSTLVDSSNQQVLARYKLLWERTQSSDRYYNENVVGEEDEFMLIKRRPRNEVHDTELLNSILSSYGLLDDKTPKLIPLKRIKKIEPPLGQGASPDANLNRELHLLTPHEKMTEYSGNKK